jgi:hypothetical protein
MEAWFPSAMHMLHLIPTLRPITKQASEARRLRMRMSGPPVDFRSRVLMAGSCTESQKQESLIITTLIATSHSGTSLVTSSSISGAVGRPA